MKEYTPIDMDHLRKRKKELGYTNEEVSRLSGVPLGTVQKAFGNITGQPRRKTILALTKVLYPELEDQFDPLLQPVHQTDDQHNNRTYTQNEIISGSEMAREAEAAYSTGIEKDHYGSFAEVTGNNFQNKRPGEYTLDDYYALPDDRRAELIDGTIYDMASPSSYHQLIAGEIHYQLLTCKKQHDMACSPMISPVDVQLNCDNKTMVVPDVIIVCDKEMIIRRCVYGAPDFVLEVLSLSTRSKDQILKLKKYLEAGCREYWIVDPENRTVSVYDFSEDNWPKVYSFRDTIPVAISDGLCSIDFSEVDDVLKEHGAYAESQNSK